MDLYIFTYIYLLIHKFITHTTTKQHVPALKLSDLSFVYMPGLNQICTVVDSLGGKKGTGNRTHLLELSNCLVVHALLYNTSFRHT